MKKLFIYLMCVATLTCSLSAQDGLLDKASVSNFLPDYSVLKPIDTGRADVQAYVYKKSDLNQSKYSSVIIDQVELYQQPIENKVTAAQISNAQDALTQGLKDMLANKVKIVNAPGNGVAILSVAITGAEVKQDGFKVRNLLPISAVAKLASRAAGVDNKKVVLIVGTKVVDSQTNELLSASITEIDGSNFRLDDSIPGEFLNAAKAWLALAMQYSKSNWNLHQGGN